MAEEAPRRVWGLNSALGHLLRCPRTAAKHRRSIPRPSWGFCAQRCWNWVGEKLGGSSWDCPALSLHPRSSLGASGAPCGAAKTPLTASPESLRGVSTRKRRVPVSGTLPSPSLAGTGEVRAEQGQEAQSCVYPWSCFHGSYPRTGRATGMTQGGRAT